MRELGAILVAEHDFADVILLSRAISKAVINVPINFVRDGQQAIEYFKGKPPYHQRAIHPIPDLLLLDLLMPHVDGFDVLRWLGGQSDLNQVSVAVLTESAHAAALEEAKALGADYFIVKPCSCGEMARELARVVEEYRLDTRLKRRVNRHGNGDPVPWNRYTLHPQLEGQLNGKQSSVASLALAASE